jgi:hypothetical protein
MAIVIIPNRPGMFNIFPTFFEKMLEIGVRGEGRGVREKTQHFYRRPYK